MRIKAIIVDDDVYACESLKLLIEQYYSEKIIIKQVVNSVKEALKAINKYDPELVFLDIEMPHETGFSLLEYFDEIGFEIIFTTAHLKYALNAIKIEAFDFLLKPIKADELGCTLDRFKNRKTKLIKRRINTFINNVENDLDLNKKVLFPSKNVYHIEKINNIIYCKAEVNYSYIYTLNKNPYLITATLKYLEELLPTKEFFRTHKSYLVNLNHILSFDKKEMKVILANNIVIDVAHRRVDELLRKLSS